MSKKKKVAVIVLVVIVIIALLTTIFVLKDKLGAIEINPDFAAEELDENAQNMNSDEDKNSAPDGGGAVSLIYSTSATISGKDITMMFENPKRSTQDMVLQIIIERDGNETVISQSNRLPAGYSLKKMTLNDNIKLSAGEYKGKFTVIYYNENSNERASVDTDIPITITVK